MIENNVHCTTNLLLNTEHIKTLLMKYSNILLYSEADMIDDTKRMKKIGIIYRKHGLNYKIC